MAEKYSEDVKKHNLHLQWHDERKEAYLYDKMPNGKVRCGVCPRRCVIGENKVGYCVISGRGRAE